MNYLLEVKQLTKRYPALLAVDHLDLGVRPGICFGLLGPNGAGKTTTLEMIEGITSPTSGEILYQGKKVDSSFKQEIGIQFQSTSLPEKIYVGEVLKLFSAFYHKKADLNMLKETCDLGEFWNRDASQLSGGQRQRLLLALALVNDPKLVFLDEPTTGLDPSARRKFWELVKMIRSQGKTIVLTTHYMEEAYELCDEIAIMDRGKIIAQGSPDRLLRENFQGLTIRIPKIENTHPFGSPLQSDFHGAQVFETTEAYEIHTSQAERTMRELLDQKVPLEGIQIRTKNLEDLFLKLTGRGIGV